MRAFLTIFICLAMACQAMADIPQEARLEVRFRVVPEDAEVFHAASASNVANQPKPIGRANQPLLLDKTKYPQGDLAVIFRAPGYQDQVMSFPIMAAIKRGALSVVLPAEGKEPVRLIKVAQSRATIALGLAVGLLGLGGGIAAYAKFRTSRVKVFDIQSWVADNVISGSDGDPLVGHKLGPYWVLEKLGHGGMATVYRACHEERLNEPLALKLIHPHVAEGADFEGRFRREVSIGSNLVHRGIVEVKDAGVLEGRHYIALELVEGKDLRSSLPPDGLSLQAALPYLTAIFEAVSFAHSKGVVHRDLKPENVLVTAEGKVKLTDFGLARSHDVTTLTATGSIMGTPGYMAPEQICGQPLNLATDQYALGVLTFELCTGRLPFVAEEMMQVLMAHLHTPPPLPSSLKPELPQGLDLLVRRMMAKEPKDRYPTVAEALRALGEVG